MLWRLVSHDILFVWERVEYLQHDDLEILTEVPFKVRNFSVFEIPQVPFAFEFVSEWPNGNSIT